MLHSYNFVDTYSKHPFESWLDEMTYNYALSLDWDEANQIFRGCQAEILIADQKAEYEAFDAF